MQRIARFLLLALLLLCFVAPPVRELGAAGVSMLTTLAVEISVPKP